MIGSLTCLTSSLSQMLSIKRSRFSMMRCAVITGQLDFARELLLQVEFLVKTYLGLILSSWLVSLAPLKKRTYLAGKLAQLFMSNNPLRDL